MDAPVPGIESTPAPVAVSPADITPSHPTNTPIAPPHISPQQMTKAERREWKRTGDLPTRRPEQAPTDSAVAASAPPTPEVPASAVTAPESAPGQSEKLRKRHEQLDRENDDLRRKIEARKALQDELRTLDLKPQAAPEQPKAEEKAWKKAAAELKNHPDAPKESDYDDAFDYMRDFSTFVHLHQQEQAEQRRSQSVRESRQQAAYDQHLSGVQEQFHSYLAANPNAVNELDQGLLQILPFSQLADPMSARPANILVEEVLASGHPGELLHFFSSDEGYAKWQELLRVPPSFMGRELGKLVGQKFLASSAAGKPQPSTKPVTRAPAPVPQMGAKAGASVDPVKAAMQSGKFSAYMEAEDAKDGTPSRWAQRRALRRG